MTELLANLKLNIKTWSRDSHGLFDYEASSTKNNQLNVNSSCKLIRKKNEVRFTTDNYEIEFEERELAKIFFEETKIIISNPLNFCMSPTEQNINDLQNKIWFVIKHDDNSQESQSSILSSGIYEIKINEIIKLGRVKYAVTEMKIEDNLQSIQEHIERPVFQLISEHKKSEEEISPDIICKICYHNSNEEDNPMINLCKCTGSISSIHFNCLKRWMNTKLSTKENEKKTVISHSMKSFNCEICMTPYPLKFKFDDKEFDIIDLVRPESKNYIILESLNQLKEKNNYKSIQIITLKENERILMGRGHDTDVRINDISVSRSHADLILIENKVYIKDLRSKFGTLVLAQKDIEFKNKQINLQIGRSYIEFTCSKESPKLKKETSNSMKFSLNSSNSGSSLDDKFLVPIFKSEEKKIIKSDNTINYSPSRDVECEIITTTQSQNLHGNNNNTKKSSIFGNFLNQNPNVNIFNATNNNSKTSSSSNLNINESQNNNPNKSIFSSSLNPINNIDNSFNFFKAPTNEKVNNNSDFQINICNKIGNIKNEVQTNKNFNKNNFSIFNNKHINNLEDVDNKNAILQNPLIDNCETNQTNNIVINNNLRNINTNKNFDKGIFSLGLFDIPNNQNTFVNKNQSLFSFDLNSIPNELINGFIPNFNNKNNLNNDVNMSNSLINSISKNLKMNLNSETNINYINSFHDNNAEKNTQKLNLQNTNNQEMFQFQNQISNQNNNNNNILHNNDQKNTKSFFNPGYLDINSYEMKYNLFNSFNSFQNHFNVNNNPAGQNNFTNIVNQKNFHNYNTNQLANPQITYTNFPINMNNLNANPQLLNNFFNNAMQMNNNNNENQSFKTESNDIDNN